MRQPSGSMIWRRVSFSRAVPKKFFHDFPFSPDVAEEDIFDHFLTCGDIRYVVKTGFAAYVQFASASAASQALGLEMILNGDPYTLCRIAADDRIDHAQVIENTKDIKYRKPFIIVENYPELPFEDLARYKSNFDSIAPVRHFKVAPTGDQTVTLALCMDKANDRDAVISRFNGAIISDKKLKVYMAPGKARMTPAHLAKYAICKNSITVDNVRPCKLAHQDRNHPDQAKLITSILSNPRFQRLRRVYAVPEVWLHQFPGTNREPVDHLLR